MNNELKLLTLSMSIVASFISLYHNPIKTKIIYN